LLFGLNELAGEATRDALIDMMHGAILFASDNSLPFPKAIVFFTIYMAVLRDTISSPFYLPEERYSKYEKLLLAHSLDRPPYAAAIFELADVKLINDFFVNTFFRNIKLIINCFSQKPVMEFRTQFPVHVPTPELPALSEMEMFGTSRPEEEREETGKTGKSPRSPRTPRSQAPPPPPPPSDDGVDDRGPEVPVEALRTSLASMHEKFATDFDEREWQLLEKIRELEIRLLEQQQLKKPPPKKK
jgi:hypothetical protein